MTKEEMFKLGFRIAESIYLKPGQVVKSEKEILAEMPKEELQSPISYNRFYGIKVKAPTPQYSDVLRLG